MEERYITSKIEPPEAKFFGVITLQDGEFHTGFALWHKRNDPQIPQIFLGPTGPRFPSYTPAASHPEPLYTPDTAKATLYTPEPRPTPPTILPTPYFGLIHPEGGIS